MTPAPYLQHLPGFSSANELGLFFEGALGVVLTGLMVLLFLRDWRSALSWC